MFEDDMPSNGLLCGFPLELTVHYLFYWKLHNNTLTNPWQSSQIQFYYNNMLCRHNNSHHANKHVKPQQWETDLVRLQVQLFWTLSLGWFGLNTERKKKQTITTTTCWPNQIKVIKYHRKAPASVATRFVETSACLKGPFVTFVS